MNAKALKFFLTCAFSVVLPVDRVHILVLPVSAHIINLIPTYSDKYLWQKELLVISSGLESGAMSRVLFTIC